jgi:hypothetical protein
MSDTLNNPEVAAVKATLESISFEDFSREDLEEFAKEGYKFAVFCSIERVCFALSIMMMDLTSEQKQVLEGMANTSMDLTDPSGEIMGNLLSKHSQENMIEDN